MRLHELTLSLGLSRRSHVGQTLAGLTQRMGELPAEAVAHPCPLKFPLRLIWPEPSQRRNSWDKIPAWPLGFVPCPGHPPLPSLYRGPEQEGSAWPTKFGSTLPPSTGTAWHKGRFTRPPPCTAGARCICSRLPGAHQALNMLPSLFAWVPGPVPPDPFPCFIYFSQTAGAEEKGEAWGLQWGFLCPPANGIPPRA